MYQASRQKRVPVNDRRLVTVRVWAPESSEQLRSESHHEQKKDDSMRLNEVTCEGRARDANSELRRRRRATPQAVIEEA
jgi:hypothetical protein